MRLGFRVIHLFDEIYTIAQVLQINSIDNVGEKVEETVQKILDSFKDFGL